jgi:hypothetical protein
VKTTSEVSPVLERDGLTDARFESDGEPAKSADGVRFEAVSGPLIRACAKANASLTNNTAALFVNAAEGEELDEIYRAGAT